MDNRTSSTTGIPLSFCRPLTVDCDVSLLLPTIVFPATGVGESDPPCGIRLSPDRDIASLTAALLNPVGNHKMGEKSKREYD
jgi:hypothetical protein